MPSVPALSHLRGLWLGAGPKPGYASRASPLPHSPRRLRPIPRSPRRHKATESKPDAGSVTSALLGPTASLFLVAVLWGTNPICLRFLDRGADPPPAALLTAVQSLSAAAWLWALQAVIRPPQSSAPPSEPSESREPSSSLVAAALPALELGCWTFCANAATVIGFEQASASRGAFLIRLTAVFTPIVALSQGQNSDRTVWTGSVVALLGGILITLGGSPDASLQGLFSGLEGGELIMVAAALLWSCQTVRLGRYVASRQPLQLATQQMAVTGLFCLAWAAWDATHSGAGNGNYSLQAWRDPVRLGALLWPAIGPWGLGTYLQMQGQRDVSAARTQIILASDPVWATIFAGVLLGADEQNLGPVGWVGAACILAASLLSRE